MTAVAHAPEATPSPALRVGGSSFYLAMRLLGREQREAMFAIYSFCRAVDDVADGDAPRETRLAQLSDWRRRIDDLFKGRATGLDDLRRAVVRYGLLKQDFLAMIEGMEMDARADIRAPSLEDLEYYCDRVACSVGRLSVRVFGLDQPQGDDLAHHLGTALQLANILRDIDEDAEIGRLYLPKEALDIAGITTRDPCTVVNDPKVGAACEFLVPLIQQHFRKADEIMLRSPRYAVRAPKIMSEVYQKIFKTMVERGWLPPRSRVRLKKLVLVWIALRHAFS
ncbi:MAG: presqualene diphosphate synthase HpnD [Pseudolabrys sp.]|nr:presqualene diphosphate synthase HpnD [Pseudolabrys sp.]